MSREYEAYCASLEVELFGGRNAFRCLHFRKWFPRLRENDSLLVKALGFQDWHFIQHHADCDREAANRAKVTTRKPCPMDQECKHNGHRNTYPVLDEKFSRRRICFRILPSQSRHDITNKIEWEGWLVRRMADWPPLMRTMFAERWKPSRKSKRPLSNENTAPLRWSRSMRITLDRVELLGMAFTEEPREMALMTELFGLLSVEAVSLRCIRDVVKPPRRSRPKHKPRDVEPPEVTPTVTPDESETASTGEQLAPDPEAGGARNSPSIREKIKGKDAPAHKGGKGGAIVPTNTDVEVGATQNRPARKADVIIVAHAKETAGADGDQTPEVSIDETSPIVARRKKLYTEIVVRSPRFCGDEDWLGEQERARPPNKRPRTTEFATPFPYTRRPDADDLAGWKGSWLRFCKAQEILRRIPGVDMSKHRIPTPMLARREPEGNV